MAIAMSEQGVQLLSAYSNSYAILHTRYVGCTVITLPLTIFMGKLRQSKISFRTSTMLHTPLDGLHLLQADNVFMTLKFFIHVSELEDKMLFV